MFDCSARLRSLRADRAVEPAYSSSLADEKRVHSLLLSTPEARSEFDCSARLRSLRADRAVEPAYFVVARRRKACPLTPPQHGGCAIRV
jgi:hypothetical protein